MAKIETVVGVHVATVKGTEAIEVVIVSAAVAATVAIGVAVTFKWATECWIATDPTR